MFLETMAQAFGGFDLRSRLGLRQIILLFGLGVDALRLLLGWPGMAKGAPKSFGMGWNAQGCP